MKADLAVRTPVKNVCEETRLDPAHGGSAFWHLLPRVLGLAFNRCCFKNAIDVLRKRNFCSGIFLRGGSKLPPSSFFQKIVMLYYRNANFGFRSLPGVPKMVKIGPQRPPGGPKMAKMEPQEAPNDAHDHLKDPPRAPKGST